MSKIIDIERFRNQRDQDLEMNQELETLDLICSQLETYRRLSPKQKKAIKVQKPRLVEGLDFMTDTITQVRHDFWDRT